MRRRYIIGILIGVVIFLIYLQFGREEKVVNTQISTSKTFYKQEFSVVANKLLIVDKEMYADKLIEKGIDNKYKNVRFSYDISGYPNEIRILVYVDNWHYLHNQCLFEIIYSEGNKHINIFNE